MSEAEIVRLLDMEPPKPGERCELGGGRVNKKRSENEPAKTVRVVFTLPADRAEPVEEGIDALMEIVGADPYSYPKGHLLEALLVFRGAAEGIPYCVLQWRRRLDNAESPRTRKPCGCSPRANSRSSASIRRSSSLSARATPRTTPWVGIWSTGGALARPIPTALTFVHCGW